MTDCECLTVKYYADTKEWRCMMCYRKYQPAEVTRVTCRKGSWVFLPFNVEKHGTG